MLGRMGLVSQALVLLLGGVLAVLLGMLGGVRGVLCVLGGVRRVLLRVLGVRGVLPMLRVWRVLWVLGVLAVLAMLVVWAMLAVLGEVLCVGRAVARVGVLARELGRVGQGHLATAAGVVVCQAVLGADCATGGVLIGAGGMGLLGRLRWHAHQTLLAEGLLKDRLVKAAEGGTEIFKVGEEELLVPLWHTVLGLGRLLEAHGLRH